VDYGGERASVGALDGGQEMLDSLLLVSLSTKNKTKLRVYTACQIISKNKNTPHVPFNNKWLTAILLICIFFPPSHFTRAEPTGFGTGSAFRDIFTCGNVDTDSDHTYAPTKPRSIDHSSPLTLRTAHRPNWLPCLLDPL